MRKLPFRCLFTLIILLNVNSCLSLGKKIKVWKEDVKELEQEAKDYTKELEESIK